MVICSPDLVAAASGTLSLNDSSLFQASGEVHYLGDPLIHSIIDSLDEIDLTSFIRISWKGPTRARKGFRRVRTALPDLFTYTVE